MALKILMILVCSLVKLGAHPSQSIDIANYIFKYSIQYRIDPLLILSVMKNESNFRSKTNAKTHDYGIMQIHCPKRNYDFYCKDLKKLKRLEYNIKIGIYLMAKFRKNCLTNHKHKSHWIRHYNWNQRNYDKAILKTLERTRKVVESCESQN